MILAVPAVIACTEPVEVTVATEGLELDQTPPAVPLELNDDEAPTHKVAVPVMVPAETDGSTVNEDHEETGEPQPLFTV